MAGTGAGKDVGSFGSSPAMAWSIIPASAALRVMGAIEAAAGAVIAILAAQVVLHAL